VVRHRFDPVAFVFGAVLAAAGMIVLTGGDLIDEGRALVPAGLIALGVAVLVHVGRRSRPPAAAVPEPTSAGAVASDADLDRLFAPVDDVLADWDAERAGPDPTAVAAADEDAVAPTDPTEVDPTGVDTTDVKPTDADPTEVVDPTERYPRPG
jgi:hypothetical protein